MKKKAVLNVLILLVICFIWGNSMKTGTESGRLSSSLLKLFPFLNILGEHVVRKLGHFSEFTALGFLLLLRFRMDGRPLSLPLVCGILTAMTDETIQMFSPGRSCEVLDVWIDTAGVSFGMMLALAACIIYRKLMKGTKMQ